MLTLSSGPNHVDRKTVITPIRRPYLILFVLAMLFAPLPGIGEVNGATGREETRLPTSQREIIYEGMISYGNYRLFGAAEDAKLYAAGVEYDRELWPRVL